MPGALEGLRVIDFGQYIAGPLAAVMLADEVHLRSFCSCHCCAARMDVIPSGITMFGPL